MAVEDKYVETSYFNASGELLKKLPSWKNGSSRAGAMIARAAIADVDSDGSKYRLFANVPSTLRPFRIQFWCDAITGGTDYDLGFYKPLKDGGAVIDKDNLMDGQTMATAVNISGTALNGMSAVVHADLGKMLYELAGLTYAQSLANRHIDIVLTANTVGTASGNITCLMEYLLDG